MQHISERLPIWDWFDEDAMESASKHNIIVQTSIRTYTQKPDEYGNTRLNIVYRITDANKRPAIGIDYMSQDAMSCKSLKDSLHTALIRSFFGPQTATSSKLLCRYDDIQDPKAEWNVPYFDRVIRCIQFHTTPYDKPIDWMGINPQILAYAGFAMFANNTSPFFDPYNDYSEQNATTILRRFADFANQRKQFAEYMNTDALDLYSFNMSYMHGPETGLYEYVPLTKNYKEWYIDYVKKCDEAMETAYARYADQNWDNLLGTLFTTPTMTLKEYAEFDI